MIVLGKEPEFLSVALSVVKDDGALPTAFLIVIEFAEMGDDALARPSIGAYAFDERIVGVGLALFASLIASEKHPCLLGASMVKEARELQGGRFPLQRQNGVSTTKNTGNSRGKEPKIAQTLSQVLNLG